MQAVTIIGNLVDDPKVLTTGSGGKGAKFTLALNSGERGTETERVDFIDVTVFNSRNASLADNVLASLRKGHFTFVQGRMTTYKVNVKNTEGEDIKVTKTGITGTYVGGSLNSMSATYQRNERSDGGQAAAAQAQDQVPAPAPAPAAAGVGGDDMF